MKIDTKNTQLSNYTTFNVGGPCRGILSISTPSELVEAVGYFKDNNLPFIVIGSGSNLLISDAGIDSFVICYTSDSL